MRFLISPSDATRLPLVAEFPDQRLAQLEGANGVGKSITIQLLELCSGRRPRMTKAEWVDLCAALGRLEIELTNLDGASSVTWVLDGGRLAERSEQADAEQASVEERPGFGPEDRRRARLARRVEAPPAADWFESIRIDGSSVRHLDQVRALLAVDRIAGDVGLVDTIAEFGLRQGLEARRLLDSRMDVARLDDAAELLEAAADILQPVSAVRLVERRRAADEAKRELAVAIAARDGSAKRVNELEAVAQNASRAAKIATDAPTLRAERQRRSEEIEQAKLEATTVAAKRQQLSERIAGSGELETKLRKAETTAKRFNTQLENASATLVELRTIGGVDAHDDVAVRAVEVREQLGHARATRDARDARPALREHMPQLLKPVRDLAARRLGAQVIVAAGDDHEPLTVDQLAGGLERRDAQLRRPDAASETTHDDVEILERSLKALDELPAAADRVSRLTTSRKRSRDSVDELAAALSSPLADELRVIQAESEEIDERILRASTERALLAKQLEQLGTEIEREQLDTLVAAELQRLEIAPDALMDELRRAVAALTEDERACEATRVTFDEAAASAARDEAELRAAVDALAEPRFDWIRAAGHSLPAIEAGLDAVAIELDRLERGLVTARDRVDRSRTPGLGIQETARTAADQLRTGSVITAGQPRLDRHIAALEAQTADQLAQPGVVAALLGEGAHDVKVDLRARQVSWTVGGHHRTQSLEAFSSGEQAFGFLKARLELTSPDTRAARNRLVALDEFGAFISGERQRDLRTWLSRWSAEQPTLQLLLILPARDFQDLAERAVGEERDRYDQLAQLMRSPGYAFTELDESLA